MLKTGASERGMLLNEGEARLGHDCAPHMLGAVSRRCRRFYLPSQGELSWLPSFAGSQLTPTLRLACLSVITIGACHMAASPGDVAKKIVTPQRRVT